MARRPATLSQAEIARTIRAAKQTGAREVEVRVGSDTRIIVRLDRTEEEVNSWDDR